MRRLPDYIGECPPDCVWQFRGSAPDKIGPCVILHERERGICLKWYKNGMDYMSEAFYKRSIRLKRHISLPPYHDKSLSDDIHGHMVKHILRNKWRRRLA